MKYFIEENFLNNSTCENIIRDFESSNFSKDSYKIHGNRNFFSSTSIEINTFIQESEYFKKLIQKINSKKFLSDCLEKLNVDSSQFILKNFYKKNKISSQYLKYKKLSSQSVGTLKPLTLIKVALYKFYIDLLRKIKFSKIFYFQKKPVELLYDFSKAGNGYSREIHRDSDSRLLVILIYLNDFPKGDFYEGGNFEIYKLIDGSKEVAQPNKKDCKIINTVKPKQGKLVVFLNDNESFHAVSKMTNHSGYRYFIYGGFTLLNQKNPFITNTSRLDTEFHFYD